MEIVLGVAPDPSTPVTPPTLRVAPFVPSHDFFSALPGLLQRGVVVGAPPFDEV